MLFFAFYATSIVAQNSFTQADRRTLLELSVKMSNLEQRQLELREDMNKRFEQVESRFDHVERSIDRIYIVLTILCSVFVALVTGLFWFVNNERKSQLETVKLLIEKINFLETSQIVITKLLATLKELAIKDEKLREAMVHNILI